MRKLDGICQQGKERLHAGCDGGGQGLRIACCVACGKGAVRAALAWKGRMKTRRVRAAAPQGGQHVVVAPECPGLRQWHSELTGCDMCAERSMYQQPGADRGVQPKQAGGRVLEQNETAMCTERKCLARLCRDDDTDNSELCAGVGAGMPVGCRTVWTGSGPPGRRRAREKEAQGGAAAAAAPTMPEDASRQRSRKWRSSKLVGAPRTDPPALHAG